MMPSTVFVLLVLLPALAHQNEFDSVKARLTKIHDMATLFEEIEKEGERAVVTIGVLPAVKSAHIERFLEVNTNFALEFGGFARYVVYLAWLYLSEGELKRFQRTVRDINGALYYVP